MKKYIITEGKFDKLLLEKILEQNLNGHAQVIETSGTSAAIAMANAVLSDEEGEVILVVDADSTDEKRIKERYTQLTFLLERASTKHNFQIFLISPEIETLFFQDKEVANTIAQRELNDFELKLAASSPREALRIYRGIEGKSRFKLLDELTTDLLNRIRQLTTVKEIVSAI
jgi:5S rRNA maturation endonuclease (ribonuclease M5)